MLVNRREFIKVTGAGVAYRRQAGFVLVAQRQVEDELGAGAEAKLAGYRCVIARLGHALSRSVAAGVAILSCSAVGDGALQGGQVHQNLVFEHQQVAKPLAGGFRTLTRAQRDDLRADLVNRLMDRLQGLEFGQMAVAYGAMTVIPMAEAAGAMIGQFGLGKRQAGAFDIEHQTFHPLQMVILGDQKREIAHFPARVGPQYPLRVGTVAGDPGGNLAGRHGRGDAVALGDVAAQAHQQDALLGILHAFGDDDPPESGGQADGAFNQGERIGAVEDVVDETLVDLEDIRRDFPEIGQ